MLAPQRYDEVAETLLIKFDQPPAMVIFFCRHAIENGGCGGVFLAKSGGIGGIDAAILLL
jgi:hypothetical protein